MQATKTVQLAFLISFGFLAAGLAQDAAPEMSARDMFRKAKNRFWSSQSKDVKRPTRPVVAQATRPPRAKAAAPKVRPPAPENPPQPVYGDPNRAQLIPVVDQPLGLKYSILKRTADGGAEEADPQSEFKSGDSIRLSVEATDLAYLYIVSKGSSGRWQALFPTSKIAGGANQVEPDVRYVIPPGGWFSFDETVGEEKLFVMLSRLPVEDLDSLIYDFGTRRPSQQPRPPAGSVQVAQGATVDDNLIAELRTASTRDLVFEAVNDEDKPPAGVRPANYEKAAYVVTKTGGDSARVVADLTLVHR